MILVCIVASIALIALGIVLYMVCDSEIISALSVVIGGVALVVSLIALVCLSVSVSGLKVIDNKIEMYQEENAKIEAQIAVTVEKYQQHETNIFTEVAPDSSITLVALYPELKSDTLVQSQIEVYIENNNKIKSLKEEKINGSVYRWWLYFG